MPLPKKFYFGSGRIFRLYKGSQSVYIAPRLTALTLVSAAQGVTSSVTTDVADESLYAVLIPVSAPAPSYQQIVAGMDGADLAAVATASIASPTTGENTFSPFASIAAGEYTVYVAQATTQGETVVSDTVIVSESSIDLVVLNGEQNLRTTTAQAGSLESMTVAWYGTPTGSVGQRVVFSVFGRIQLRYFTTGRLLIEISRGLNDQVVNWTSTDGYNDTDPALWVVSYDGAAGTLTVTRDGVTVAGDGTVLVGSADFNRTHTVVGAGAGSAPTTNNPFIGKLAMVAVFDRIVTHADLSGVDPATLNPEPLILFKGPASAWNSGVNQVSNGTTWTVTGLVTDDGASTPAALPLRTSHGFGKATTGGQGGRVVLVTNTNGDTSTGSLRWAMTQYPSEATVIIPVVEGHCDFGANQIYLEKDNTTIDWRFAPGNGFWVTGERFGFRGSNVHLIQPLILGNSPVASQNAKTSVGYYTNDPDSTNLVDRVYIENGLILYGRDETLSFVARGNGMATGSRITNVTVDGTVMGVPVSETDPPHDFTHFIGDGVIGYSCTRNLMIHGRARNPFVRGYAREIEVVNCMVYNFGLTGASAGPPAGVQVNTHLVGNVFRGGPYTSSTPRPFLAYDSGGEIYAADNLLENLPAGTTFLNYPQGGSDWTIRSTPFFTESDYAPSAASAVANWISQNAGPKVHGGARHPLAQALIDDMNNGTGPNTTSTYPGTLPAVTGASYPAHTDYVPNAYLADYPSDNDLEAVISGGDWDGYQVWQRVGTWLITG